MAWRSWTRRDNLIYAQATTASGPTPSATRPRSFLIYATSASPRRWRSRHAARSAPTACSGSTRPGARWRRESPGRPGDRNRPRRRKIRARRRGESGRGARRRAKAALQLRYWIRALQHADHSVTVAPFASRGDRHKTECLFCRCGVAPWHPRPANFGIPAHGLCHSEVACDKCVVKNEEALQDERRPKNLRKPLFWFRPDPHPVIVPVDRPLAPAVEPPAPPRNGRAAAALARINEGAANRAPDGPLRVSLLACAAALRAAARAEGAGRAAEAAEAAERVVKKHPAPPHPLIRDAYALGVDYVCQCVASGLGPAHAGNVERWRSFVTSRVMDEEERLFEDRVEACWRIVLDEVAPGVARDAATKAHAAALRAGRKRLAALARKFRRACERAADGAVAVARAAGGARRARRARCGRARARRGQAQRAGGARPAGHAAYRGSGPKRGRGGIRVGRELRVGLGRVGRRERLWLCFEYRRGRRRRRRRRL